MTNPFRLVLVVLAALLATSAGCDTSGASSSGPPPTTGAAGPMPDGSAARPLRVVLIPADGGTEQGTRADFEPVFNAITKGYGLHFDLRVAQSYQAVVEGMVNRRVDVAFVGLVTYHQARQAGAAELLAIAVTGGQSVYHSGVFVPADSPAKTAADLKGRSIAFGDVNSTSSFHAPLAMVIAAGVDPGRDLGAVRITGSHSNALAALATGKVDAAACAFTSFEKAVNEGHVDPAKVRLLAKSEPIPFPPLAMHRDLDPAVKKKLREAFASVHARPDVTPEMVRGYGGKRVDRYDVEYPEASFDAAMAKLAAVTPELTAELLRKAGK